MTTNYPDAVVAVVGSKAINGYPYEVAVVYHLATRKRDGELIYRKSDVNYARPRRSHRLAVLDAQHVSEDLGFPFWEGTRHGNVSISPRIGKDTTHGNVSTKPGKRLRLNRSRVKQPE